jgi:hypothetical protein
MRINAGASSPPSNLRAAGLRASRRGGAAQKRAGAAAVAAAHTRHCGRHTCPLLPRYSFLTHLCIPPSLPLFTRCRHPTATTIPALRPGWPAIRVGCASANATRRCRAHSAPSKLKARSLPRCLTHSLEGEACHVTTRDLVLSHQLQNPIACGIFTLSMRRSQIFSQ